MEIIPLIRLKKRKIFAEREGLNISLNDLSKKVDKDDKIYVLDIDGIEKNKPNLCLYPKLSENHKIWVDAGPRELGDVIDLILAGATNITIRKKIWPKLDIINIKEITEGEIYFEIDPKIHNIKDSNLSLLSEFHGFVNFTDRNQTEVDFNFRSFLKSLSIKNKIYTYEVDQNNFSYWKKLGFTGLLVDVERTGGFK